MKGKMSSEILAQPVKRAARVVARARLDVVRAASDRLAVDAPDALHDLRVGLRRLRSWLRAFRPELDDTVRGKTRRRLRDLTHATNAARDAEVWTEWIVAQTGLPPRARPGSRYVAKWMRSECEAALRSSTKRVRRRLPDLLNALELELSSYSASVSVDDQSGRETTMAVAMAELITSQHQRLMRRLERIESVRDVGAMHRCRIAAKRLRYLLEALDNVPAANDALAHLVELQDTLGTVRDLRLFVERIVERIGVIAMLDARRRAARALAVDSHDVSVPVLSRVRPGMLALAKRAHREEIAAFEQFRAAWDQARLGVLETELAAVIETFDRV